MDELVPYLRAILALQVAHLSETQPGIKSEVTLGRAGLGIQEIADIMGKSYPAVAKSLSRGGVATKRRRTGEG